MNINEIDSATSPLDSEVLSLQNKFLGGSSGYPGSGHPVFNSTDNDEVDLKDFSTLNESGDDEVSKKLVNLHNDIVKKVNDSKLYQIIKKIPNEFKLSAKDLDKLDCEFVVTIENYLRDHQNTFDTLGFNINDKVQKDLNTFTSLYESLSSELLNSGDETAVKNTMKIVGMKGGGLSNTQITQLRNLSLKLKAYLGILRRVYYGKQVNNGYGINSQPYSQKPFGVSNYKLTLAEKAGMRQLMDELDGLSRMITLKLIAPSNNKLPPYSMIKEITKMGINLDDDRFEVTSKNNTTNSNLANMLRKYVEYRHLLLIV